MILEPSALWLLAFGARDDTFSELGWSSPDGVTWTGIDVSRVLVGAVVDDLFSIGDSLLVAGRLDQSDGTREPVAWLLRPTPG